MTKRPYDSGRKDSLGRRISAPGTRRHERAEVDAGPGGEEERDDRALARRERSLREIGESSVLAADLVGRLSEDEFVGDLVMQAAGSAIVSRIGEAAKQLPEEFKTEHPHVEWDELWAMRIKLVHHYQATDPRILWYALAVKVPALAAELGLDLPK